MRNQIVDFGPVKLDAVTQLPGNANVADEDILEDSLRKHGITAPIVVNKRTMHVVDGNHRYAQYLAQGLKEAQAAFIDVDETEEVAIAIDLAHSARTARWDDGLLLKAFEDNEALKELTTLSQKQLNDLAEKASGEEPKEKTVECPKCGHEFAPYPRRS